MISICEAVVPATTAQQKPVSGAVVPQSHQQPQQNQVPTQQSVTQPQQNINPEAGEQTQHVQTEPTWKKYLRNAAIVGAGIGAGGLIYGVASNWDDIKSTVGSWLPGSSVPVPNDEEKTEDITDGDTKNNNMVQRATSRVPRRFEGEPLRPSRTSEMVGPPPQEHIPMRSGGFYRTVWPQPGHSPKQLDPYTQRQYYGSRGGWWGWGNSSDSEWGTNSDNSSYYNNSSYRSMVRPIRQPITDYDLGRRHGDMNGA